MMDTNSIQLLAQLIDSMDIALKKLEKAYANNDSEYFKISRETILDFQKKISEITQI